MKVRRIPELPIPGRRLGRHVRHDPRSLAYQVAAGPRSALVSVKHKRQIPVLDQGDLGSCTGNACEGALGTSPLYEAIPIDDVDRPTGDADADEQQAVMLYSAATAVDEYDGRYPPTDTGSSGLGVAKAAKDAGLISGYQHATSLDAALTALQNGPVITGVNWYSSFDTPARDGTITITKGAYVRGGHEFVVDELDVERRRVGFPNSWGLGWGLNGRAYMSWDTWGRLLGEDGDVTVFVPADQPAPVPTPTPDEPTGCAGQVLAVLDKARADIKAIFGL